MGQRIDWFKPFTKVKNTSWARDNVSIRWYEDGTTNAAYNALDRHLASRGDQTALIFEPDDPAEEARHISYKELHEQVSRLANVLKANGVKKGNRVTIYLPMIPEAAYAMLACARRALTGPNGSQRTQNSLRRPMGPQDAGGHAGG